MNERLEAFQKSNVLCFGKCIYFPSGTAEKAQNLLAGFPLAASEVNGEISLQSATERK